MHPPQQPLRPQGPYPLQQQLQQPVPAHAQYAQLQSAAGRPMMKMNQAVPQQPLAQPPAQNYMPKSSAHPQMSTVQQQQFQLPRPGSQSQLGASMVAPQTAGFSKQGDSSLENSGKAPGSADGGIGSTELVSAHMDGSKMTDMSDSKTVEDEKNVHHGDVDNKPDVNGVVETSQMHGKEPKFGMQEDDLDDVAVEQTVKDEATGKDGILSPIMKKIERRTLFRMPKRLLKTTPKGQKLEVIALKHSKTKLNHCQLARRRPCNNTFSQLVRRCILILVIRTEICTSYLTNFPVMAQMNILACHLLIICKPGLMHLLHMWFHWLSRRDIHSSLCRMDLPCIRGLLLGLCNSPGLAKKGDFRNLHCIKCSLRQPPGSFLPEVPVGGYPGPGSIGRGPTHLAPQGQGHALPPHGAPGARPHGQPFGGPLMGGPPPEAINVPARERLVSKRPGFFDGRQPDSHMPMPAERVQFGQPSGILPNAMKMNGGPGKGQVGGAHDAAYSHNLPDERFKPLPEERYASMAEDGINPLTDERFRPFPLESSRRIIDRREFEEDLKQFPRPAHLDGEGASEFENYLSSRPGFGRGDAALRPFDRDAGPISSRLIPPHLSGGPSVHPMDIGERSRPIGPHDDILGRKMDPSLAHLDLLRPEFDRHRIENLRHQRSPGREYLGVPPARLGGFPIGVGSRLDDLDMREGRSFGERSRPHDLPPDLLGNPFHESRFPSFPPSGLEMLPGHLRRGEADMHGNSRFGEHLGPSHLRSGNREDSEFLPGHFRAGEQLGLVVYVINCEWGDVDSFEHTRKRKPGSTGWCRICKIDCSTVEGLEMHSQTREHQKKAMDIVLSIKKDNAKKQKLSEEHASNEDANKSKQPGSESHGKAH
ncbi:hypothetical protein QJS10_CPB14g00781 [Acorus calamus]|uniref:Uncharacterized protein n=1 Tax=Acorus calamus TaxID=4465 RepID=A0AAV9DE44_ACOCL|nr:hypothetical protein QJS10_CPB14g00781 [Acorus calamus]